jgi:glycosyltransferase 2 family protein
MHKRVQVLISKSIPHILTLLLLGLGIYLLAPQFASLKDSLKVIRQMSPVFVALTLGIQVASYWGSGYLMQASVGIVKQQITIFQGALVTLAANSVSLLAGGTVTALAMTFRWMHRLGVNVQGASLAGTLPYIFNNLVLLISSLFGLAYLLINHELSKLQAVFFAAVALLFLSIFVAVAWALSNRNKLIRTAHYLGRTWSTFRHRSYKPERTESAIEQLFRAWHDLRTGDWIKPLTGALLNIGFDMLTLYILFGAFGHSVSLSMLFVGYGLPLLFGKVGFLPGGLGIVEGTMVVLYRGFGVPNPILVVVILAYRLLSFWIPTLLGFSLIPYLNK